MRGEAGDAARLVHVEQPGWHALARPLHEFGGVHKSVAGRWLCPCPSSGATLRRRVLASKRCHITQEFDALFDQGVVAKYQLTARSVVVYLRQFAPGKPLLLQCGLQAPTPVSVTAPPAQIHGYYDPDRMANSEASELVVADASDV